MIPVESEILNDGFGDEIKPAVLIDEIFPEMRRWLFWEARQQTGDASLHDDLVQEAYISMWRKVPEVREEEGSTTAFFRAVARQRMKAVLSDDRRYTGRTTEESAKSVGQHAKKKGDETRQRIRDFITSYRAEHQTEPTQGEIARSLGMNSGNVNRHMKRMHMSVEAKPIKAGSLDELVDGAGDGALMDPALVVIAEELLDGVALAYHYGEIHSAIQSLSDNHREYVLARFWGGLTDAEIAAERGTTYSTVWRQWSHTIRPALISQLAHLSEVS